MSARAPGGVSWSASLGAPGPVILHLFGPSTFKDSDRELPFPFPFGGDEGILSSVSLLFTYGALIGPQVLWFAIPQWGLGVTHWSLHGWLVHIPMPTG